MGKRFEQILHRKDTQMVRKHEKMFKSLFSSEINFKTTRFFFTPTKMAKIKKTDNSKCREDTGKLEPSYIAGEIKIAGEQCCSFFL